MLSGLILQAVIVLCSSETCAITTSQPYPSEIVCENALSAAMNNEGLDRPVYEGFRIGGKCITFAKPYKPYDDYDRDRVTVAKVFHIQPPDPKARYAYKHDKAPSS